MDLFIYLNLTLGFETVNSLLCEVNITPLEPVSQMSLRDNFNFFRASAGLHPLRVILFLKVCEKC